MTGRSTTSGGSCGTATSTPTAGVGPSGAARERRQPPHRAGPVGTAMPLVMGVDSSTQATKVEVRDADSGAVVASGRAPHPVAQPPCSEQEPEAWWDGLAQAVAAAGAPEVAAISVGGAAARDGPARPPGPGPPPGEALERHRVGARGRADGRRARRGGVGGGHRVGAGRRLDHHQARLDGRPRAGRPRRGREGRAAPRLPHPPAHRSLRHRSG